MFYIIQALVAVFILIAPLVGALILSLARFVAALILLPTLLITGPCSAEEGAVSSPPKM